MVMRVQRTSALLKCTAISVIALMCGIQAAAATSDAAKPWTLADIASVPDVTEIKLSNDRRYALYIVLFGDVDRNETRSELRRVSLSDGEQITLLNAPTIMRLRKIPSSDDWSALIDRGDGVQLYRIDQTGAVTELLVNNQPILVGTADHAVPSWEHSAPKRVGIRSFDWSPDGQWLFYSKLRDVGKVGAVLYDKSVTDKRDLYRTPLDALVELRARRPSGEDFLIAVRPTNDVLSVAVDPPIEWTKDTLKYRAQGRDSSGIETYQRYSWGLTDHILREESALSKDHNLYQPAGVHGGNLVSEGVGDNRVLVETGPDGVRYDYGRVRFSVPEIRGAGSFLSRDGKFALFGARLIDELRYKLVLTDSRTAKELKFTDSLTSCDFDRDLVLGVCVREALNLPPEITLVRPREEKITRLSSVASHYDNLKKLNAVRRNWTNRLGYRASGYVIFPDRYDKGKAYPAIFVTHHTDTDERFAKTDLQWHYPIQEFVQRGYIVVLQNNVIRQDAALAAAFRKWETGEGDVSPAEMAKLLWLNPFYSLEDAAVEMAREGLIDINRVGVAGFSRGSQIANVAMTQTTTFKAASSGDGSHLEPFIYPATPTFKAIFGGSPLGPHIDNYRALSPSLRANYACGAVLEQMAAPYAAATDFYNALREAGVPAQISLYPGENQATNETHVFHIPSNRIAAMRENIAWFDFWLLGREDTDLVEKDRLEHWKRMAAQQKQCPALGKN